MPDPVPAPAKKYQVKPGAKLFLPGLGRLVKDNEVVELSDQAAFEFRDKLVPTAPAPVPAA